MDQIVCCLLIMVIIRLMSQNNSDGRDIQTIFFSFTNNATPIKVNTNMQHLKCNLSKSTKMYLKYQTAYHCKMTVVKDLLVVKFSFKKI